MENIEDVLHEAVWEYMDSEDVEGVGNYIINHLLANGYVIVAANDNNKQDIARAA